LYLLFALLLAACSSANAPTDSAEAGLKTITDELGRQVKVSHSPQRIISLSPGTTEALFALGLGERIVGVTSYCNYPEEASRKERVGDTLNPSIERIVALKPDLVIISTASQLQDLAERLNKLGIPTYISNPRTLSEILSSMERIGDLCGVKDRAEQVVAELRRRIDEVRKKVNGLSRLRVFYILQTEPLFTVGKGAYATDLIWLAGGESISKDELNPWPQFSRETAIARKPEVIILSGDARGVVTAGHFNQRQFQSTPAVKQGRVYRINADLVERPGPRIVDGLEEIARLLHPEAFK